MISIPIFIQNLSIFPASNFIIRSNPKTVLNGFKQRHHHIIVANDPWGWHQCASNADFDNDGDLDIFLTNPIQSQSNSLYRNNLSNGNHWVSFHLEGVTSNSAAYGSALWLKTTINGQQKWQYRQLNGNPTGDRSQQSTRLHFGLDAAETIDSLVIRWPSGHLIVFENMLPDSLYIIKENVNTSIKEVKDQVSLTSIFPNPAREVIHVGYTIHKAGPVNITLADLKNNLITHLTENRNVKGYHEVSLIIPMGISKGSYRVSVETSGQIVTELVMIIDN